MPTLISFEDREDRAWRIVRIAGMALLGAGAAAALAAWLARDQMVRHRNDLFSPHPLRRLAALGYLKAHPDVDNVLLLRDFLAWEERPLLRRRASGILESMEEDLVTAAESARGA